MGLSRRSFRLIILGCLLLVVACSGGTTTTSSSGGAFVVRTSVDALEFWSRLLFGVVFAFVGFVYFWLLGLIVLARIRRPAEISTPHPPTPRRLGVGSTLRVLAVALGSLLAVAFLWIWRPNSVMVTLDDSAGTVTVVQDYLLRNSIKQYDLDQVEGVRYVYTRGGENPDSGTVSLILSDRTTVEVFGDGPNATLQLARVLSTAAEVDLIER